ncbi:hypothetical protein NB311A_14030 [Nitrobacter sp. Nb-311A]|uniref:hypothetical protein n=1 Tax=Nitrobacter sp. Nb-311A TaxID=314253 RepID=UPI0000687108|nr:hypothetical protein [Nitrobacter sp. Nb-311A]EAQ35020.1 hypothetical protein NB311A_14030 [Nitrobacter sp. Nb-311A]
MPAKQKTHSRRAPRKRLSIPSIQKVYALHLEPSQGEGETSRLPPFAPVKLSKVLLAKTGRTTLGDSSDVTIDLLELIAAQQDKLLQALGFDSANPDYAQAFLALARIHHGVGVIQVESKRASNKNAKKWTKEQDDALLQAVDVRQQAGMKITDAVQQIASDETIWQKFPVTDKTDSGKLPARLRAQNYRRRLALIKKRNAAERMQSEIVKDLAKTDWTKLNTTRAYRQRIGKNQVAKITLSSKFPA